MQANTELTAHGAAKLSETKTNVIGTAKASAGVHADPVKSGATLAKSATGSSSVGVHATAASAVSAPASASATGNAVASLGGGSTAAAGSSGSAATGTSAHAGLLAQLTGRLGVMTKSAGVALKGSLAAKSLAVAAVGLAGLVVAAHTGVAPGAQASLSLVPSWSSGQSLLGGLQAGASGSGSGGIQIGL